MIIAFIVYAMPFVLAVVLVISIITAVVSFRRYRTAPYFRIRRDAQRQAWNNVLKVVICIAGIIGAVLARRVIPPPVFGGGGNLTLFPERDSTQDDTLLTPLAAVATGSTIEIIPPTITPTQPAVEATLPVTTVQAAVEVPPDAVLGITTLSSDISSDLTPVNEGTVFSAGIPRIYFWISYSGMANGVSWSQVLLRGGTIVRSESIAWSLGEAGSTYTFFDTQNGWPAGDYEIQLYLGDRLVASAAYQLID